MYLSVVGTKRKESTDSCKQGERGVVEEIGTWKYLSCPIPAGSMKAHAQRTRSYGLPHRAAARIFKNSYEHGKEEMGFEYRIKSFP